MNLFSIDPDIARAETLPAWCYRDPDFFELCRKSVFSMSWQLVGDSSRMEPIAPFEIAGEPFVKTPQGCLSNTCTHRGMLVAPTPCDATELRCPYHGRRFDLDGRCLSMPEFEGVRGFPGPRDNLSPIPSATWGPFLFAAIEPAIDFAKLWTEVPEPAEWEFAGQMDYDVAANWMLYVDNYLEGFHIPFVHPGLHEGARLRRTTRPGSSTGPTSRWAHPRKASRRPTTSGSSPT